MNNLNFTEIAFFTFLFFYVKILTIYFVQSVHIDKLNELKRRCTVCAFVEKQRSKGIRVYEMNDDIFESKQ